MPINSHVTSEEGKRKLQPKYSNPKKIEEKKISKKNLSATFQIFSNCHFPNFLSPETKCHKMQVILYRMIYKTNLYTSPPGSKKSVLQS